MRTRWKWLFVGAIVTLVGMSWLASRYDVSITIWGTTRVGGMVVAAAVAAWAMRVDCRHKWPAAVALIGASPHAADTMRAVRHLPDIAASFGAPMLLVLGGTATVFAIAILVLAKPPPPPPVEPQIAPARVVDE